jgi:hypothetical protein
MRMTGDGAIIRCCLDCTGYLLDKGMLRCDTLGVYNLAPGVTFDDTKKAVAEREGKPCR